MDERDSDNASIILKPRRNVWKIVFSVFFLFAIWILLLKYFGVLGGPYCGVVMDIDSGKPISNVKVVFEISGKIPVPIEQSRTNFKSLSTQTDSNGEYFILFWIDLRMLFAIDKMENYSLIKPGYKKHIIPYRKMYDCPGTLYMKKIRG